MTPLSEIMVDCVCQTTVKRSKYRYCWMAPNRS